MSTCAVSESGDTCSACLFRSLSFFFVFAKTKEDNFIYLDNLNLRQTNADMWRTKCGCQEATEKKAKRMQRVKGYQQIPTKENFGRINNRKLQCRNKSCLKNALLSVIQNQMSKYFVKISFSRRIQMVRIGTCWGHINHLTNFLFLYALRECDLGFPWR